MIAGEAAPLHAHQAPHRPAQHAPLAAAAVESREVLELCGPQRRWVGDVERRMNRDLEAELVTTRKRQSGIK